MIDLKRKLYTRCQQIVDTRIEASRNAIATAQSAANNETKSSSGDKYETTRSMMHLEIEKHSAQLSESLKLQQVLLQIDIYTPVNKIMLGSIVKTDRGNFFMSVSAGNLEVDGENYFSISLASPLGKSLYQKTIGDTIEVNMVKYKILHVA